MLCTYVHYGEKVSDCCECKAWSLWSVRSYVLSKRVMFVRCKWIHSGSSDLCANVMLYKKISDRHARLARAFYHCTYVYVYMFWFCEPVMRKTIYVCRLVFFWSENQFESRVLRPLISFRVILPSPPPSIWGTTSQRLMDDGEWAVMTYSQRFRGNVEYWKTRGTGDEATWASEERVNVSVYRDTAMCKCLLSDKCQEVAINFRLVTGSSCAGVNSYTNDVMDLNDGSWRVCLAVCCIGLTHL